MKVKEFIKKVVKHKAFKISLYILLVLTALSAFAGSLYFSFEKEKSKKVKPVVKVDDSLEIKKPKIEPLDRSSFKVITLNDMGNQNPFNPEQLLEVPKSTLNADKNNLVMPPLGDIQDSEAGMVMGTTISGILYDDINSSAIINIEGTEYFVKQGDVVNNYKILAIAPTQVSIKYGSNIYKAGVGELLTKVESNSNIVNLNNKFGGNFNDNISIKVRKNK